MMKHLTPSLERRFGLMGETLLFQTNSPLLLEAAREAFGRFPLPEGSGDPPLVARLLVHEAALETPAERPRPVFRAQGHLFSMNVGPENMGVADLRAGFAFGHVTPQIAADQAFVRYTFVEGLAFGMLSMARHYIPVHAACVVKNGVSIILQARAGTGKSTLAFACVRRGYRLLAEDVVHVKVCPEGVQLWGAPWKFHLLPDAKRFFPELAGEESHLQTSGEWKLEVDLEQLVPGSTCVRADPGLVVLLRRTPEGDTRLERLDPEQAAQDFEILWPWATGWTEELEHSISGLLANGAHCLLINGSPDAAVDALDGLIGA